MQIIINKQLKGADFTMKIQTHIFILASVLLLAACGNQDTDNGNKSNAQTKSDISQQQEKDKTKENKEIENEKTYREIGETFELTGYYSDGLMDITINDVWTEQGKDHAAYIEEVYSDIEEKRIAFIDFTVKNKSDKSVEYFDFLPLYSDGNSEPDLSYPKNDTFLNFDDFQNHSLEPGEEKNLVGAITLLDAYSEYQSAFTWNGQELDSGAIVFPIPQNEQKSPIGVYDIGQPFYPINHGEDGGVEVTIQDISVEKSPAGIDDNNFTTFLALDMAIANQTKQNQTIDISFPSPHTEPVIAGEIPGTVHSNYFSKNGAFINPYEGNESILEPGETIEGKLYIGIQEEEIDTVKLAYYPYSMLIDSRFALQINYNLEK